MKKILVGTLAVTLILSSTVLASEFDGFNGNMMGNRFSNSSNFMMDSENWQDAFESMETTNRGSVNNGWSEDDWNEMYEYMENYSGSMMNGWSDDDREAMYEYMENNSGYMMNDWSWNEMRDYMDRTGGCHGNRNNIYNGYERD